MDEPSLVRRVDVARWHRPYDDEPGLVRFEVTATAFCHQMVRSFVGTLVDVGLPLSVGVARTKFLAKVASDWDKPDGQFEIKPEDVAGFMQDLPVRKVWGIGPVAAGSIDDQPDP